MKALAQAVSFLTVLPWPGAPREPDMDDMARALTRFPFVGLLVGLILIALDWALALAFSVSVRSAALIVALIFLTRGISLGGLSSLPDALGFGENEEEASTGAMGVALIIGVLLLKFVCLNELHGSDRYRAILVSPVLARAAMAYLIATSSPAQETPGCGWTFVRSPSPREGRIALGWSFLLCFLLGWFWGLFWPSWFCALHGVSDASSGILKKRREMRQVAGSEFVETMTLVLYSS